VDHEDELGGNDDGEHPPSPVAVPVNKRRRDGHWQGHGTCLRLKSKKGTPASARSPARNAAVAGSSGSRVRENEQVVDEDAAFAVEHQEYEPARYYALAVGGHHFPLKSDHIAQRRGIRSSRKWVAPVADVLLVRAGDPLFERAVSARFARIDIVPAVWSPQLRNSAAATVGIGLVPHRDISIGKTLWVIHGAHLELV